MTSLIPLPYRLLALAALMLAVWGHGWFKGASHGERRLDKAVAAAERESTRLAGARRAVTETISLKYAPQLTKVREVKVETIKYVDRFVTAGDCPLSPGFRVLHDAAAEGTVPDAARIAHGAAVTAKETATTVTDNYGTCREDQLKLQGLQEWIRQQQQVK